MKILHLEDDPQKAAIIRRRIGFCQAENDVDAVQWVTNWKAFQKAIHADQSFDLVILDVCVPFGGDGKGPSGVRSLGNKSRLEARRAGYTGPIIFISSNPSGLDLSGDPKASAYWYNDTAGWCDAVAVVRTTVSEMETDGEVGHE